MFCPNCNSPMNNNSRCPTCGTVITQSSAPVKTKTKSKMVAALLMLFGIGDIYLRNWKRQWLKLLILIPTFCIGTLILQIVDTVRVLSGSISCDAKGVPLV